MKAKTASTSTLLILTCVGFVFVCMYMSTIRFFLVLLLALLAAPAFAAHELASDIAGRIVDAYGDPVEGARITVRDLDSGAVRVRYSNHRGRYVAPNVRPATRFVVSVEAPGFAPITFAALETRLARVSQRNAVLRLSAMSAYDHAVQLEMSAINRPWLTSPRYSAKGAVEAAPMRKKACGAIARVDAGADVRFDASASPGPQLLVWRYRSADVAAEPAQPAGDTCSGCCCAGTCTCVSLDTTPTPADAGKELLTR